MSILVFRPHLTRAPDTHYLSQRGRCCQLSRLSAVCLSRRALAVYVSEAYPWRMLFKRAILVVFVGLAAAAAIVAFGSVALAAGIRAAESERNRHVHPQPQ
jgi:hypothetical protein